MLEKPEIVISIRPRHAYDIFEGMKTVELRKRRPDLEPGTRAWIYATRPVAAILGYATVAKIVTESTKTIWRDFQQSLAVSEFDFANYFNGRDTAHALLLADVMQLRTGVPLEQLRASNERFHPPQFFARLDATRPERRLLHERARRATAVCPARSRLR